MADEIYSIHYRVPTSASCPTPKIFGSQIKSMQRIPINVTSWGYGDSSPHFTDYGAVDRTSGNQFIYSYSDYKEHGRLFNNDGYRHGRWLDAATKYGPNSWERVFHSKAPSTVMESFEERRATFHPKDTVVVKYVHDFHRDEHRPINYTGKDVSHLHNSKWHLMQYLRTEDGIELPTSLIAAGGKPTKIDYIAVGGLPKRAMYAITRKKDNGKVVLIAAEDAYDRLAKEAKYWNISIYDLMNMVFFEELGHAWLRDFDNPSLSEEEIETRINKIRSGHYSRLEEGAEGEPKKLWLKEKRKKQAEVARKYLLTVHDRYSEKGSFFKQLYSEKREDLEYLLTEEAIEKKGYRGKAAKEYASKRLEEIGEEVEGDRGKDRRMSKLEKIADKGREEKSEARESPAEAAAE